MQRRTRPRTTEEHVVIADLAFKEQRYEVALTHYNIAAAENHVRASHALANMYAKALGCVRDYPQCHALLTRAHVLAPTDVAIIIDLAQLYVQDYSPIQDIKTAEDLCHKGLKLATEAEQKAKIHLILADIARINFTITPQERFKRVSHHFDECRNSYRAASFFGKSGFDQKTFEITDRKLTYQYDELRTLQRSLNDQLNMDLFPNIDETKHPILKGDKLLSCVESAVANQTHLFKVCLSMLDHKNPTDRVSLDIRKMLVDLIAKNGAITFQTIQVPSILTAIQHNNNLKRIIYVLTEYYQTQLPKLQQYYSQVQLTLQHLKIAIASTKFQIMHTITLFEKPLSSGSYSTNTPYAIDRINTELKYLPSDSSRTFSIYREVMTLLREVITANSATHPDTQQFYLVAQEKLTGFSFNQSASTSACEEIESATVTFGGETLTSAASFYATHDFTPEAIAAQVAAKAAADALRAKAEATKAAQTTEPPPSYFSARPVGF